MHSMYTAISINNKISYLIKSIETTNNYDTVVILKFQGLLKYVQIRRFHFVWENINM